MCSLFCGTAGRVRTVFAPPPPPALPGTDASSPGAGAEMGTGGQRGMPALPCSVPHSVPARSQEARGPSKSQLQLRPPLTGEGVSTSGRGWGRVPGEQLPDASGRGHSLGFDTRLVVRSWGNLPGPTLPRSLRTPRCGCKQGGVPILKTQPASTSAPGPRAPIPTLGGTPLPGAHSLQGGGGRWRPLGK